MGFQHTHKILNSLKEHNLHPWTTFLSVCGYCANWRVVVWGPTRLWTLNAGAEVCGAPRMSRHALKGRRSSSCRERWSMKLCDAQCCEVSNISYSFFFFLMWQFLAEDVDNFYDRPLKPERDVIIIMIILIIIIITITFFLFLHSLKWDSQPT
jgi:hypothetical protein